MANIFLSYRRTDGPQACRVYDSLVERFGKDAVFMDVSAIPFAVSFSDSIREAIAGSNVMIALIGSEWAKRVALPNDAVRMELETAMERHVPILPVLIGTAVMPTKEELPETIANLALQQALTLGVLHDFDAHMRTLLSELEAILGRVSVDNIVTTNPDVIRKVSEGIVEFLRTRFADDSGRSGGQGVYAEWVIYGSAELRHVDNSTRVSFYLHRVARVAERLELHFILSVFSNFSNVEHALTGWILHTMERTPVIAGTFFPEVPDCTVKIRRSDEDPRQVWKMITDDQPLRLSLAYVASVSPRVLTKP